MNRKINMFTLIIFAYSVVICVTFKKDQVINRTATAKIETTPAKYIKSAEVKVEPITASNAPLANPNQ